MGYTTEEAAALLNIKPVTVRAHIAQGNLTAERTSAHGFGANPAPLLSVGYVVSNQTCLNSRGSLRPMHHRYLESCRRDLAPGA